MTSSPQLWLNLTCDSRRGQVAAVTRVLEDHEAYIKEFSVYDDPDEARFFLRAVFHSAASPEAIQAALGGDMGIFPSARIQAGRFSEPARVLIMVSRQDHCLRELISAWRREELNMDIVAVVSNHEDARAIVEVEGIPFHHLPITADTKPQQEAQVMRLIETTGAEFIVLARYMQVLSADLCQRLKGRVINIHHSFLPGFKGARPYHQAHERGVKLIGATAHFATTDLDEGPIIEQALERVDHADSPEQLRNAGRHIECLVLSRALRFVLERRVFTNGLRTVVLR
ncbi:formyltetrahydrofolate deformylase [Caldimonas tepidiphila]|uniref:formyltetrahydrofolate deformylase n=1 Tax=Caldimonas tepidiphila TaxID=2315841 RepID=UPI00196AB514|nr:formyltetrahydrofolate deformylase [Caldimonas tepidiphila]